MSHLTDIFQLISQLYQKYLTFSLTSYSPPQSLAQQAGPGLKMFLYFTVTQRLDDFRHSFVKFFGHEPVSNTDRR